MGLLAPFGFVVSSGFDLGGGNAPVVICSQFTMVDRSSRHPLMMDGEQESNQQNEPFSLDLPVCLPLVVGTCYLDAFLLLILILVESPAMMIHGMIWTK